MKTKVIRLTEYDMLPKGKLKSKRRTHHPNSTWTDEEVDYLFKWIGKKTYAEIAKHIGKNKTCVAQYAARKGVFPGHPTAWTPEEEAQLKKLYKTHKIKDIAKLLGRSFASIKNKAACMMLLRGKR